MALLTLRTLTSAKPSGATGTGVAGGQCALPGGGQQALLREGRTLTFVARSWAGAGLTRSAARGPIARSRVQQPGDLARRAHGTSVAHPQAQALPSLTAAGDSAHCDAPGCWKTGCGCYFCRSRNSSNPDANESATSDATNTLFVTYQW